MHDHRYSLCVSRPPLALLHSLLDGRASSFLEPVAFPVNIKDTEGAAAVEIHAELPGIPESAITVRTEGNELVVAVQHEESANGEQAGWTHTERRSIGSERRFRFNPQVVDTAGITATLKHGVLLVRVPKKVPEQRTINVQVAQAA